MPSTIPALSIHGNWVDVEKDKFKIRAAGYCLIVHEEKILLVKTRSTGKWFLPGGGVEVGEPIEEAIIRWVFEEAGIKIEVERFLTFREIFFYYDPTGDAFQTYAMFFSCTPLTFELTEEHNEAGDESELPTWVEIESLSEEDFQEGLYEVIKLHLSKE